MGFFKAIASVAKAILPAAMAILPNIKSLTTIASAVLNLGAVLFKRHEDKFAKALESVAMVEQKANEARSLGVSDAAQTVAFLSSVATTSLGQKRREQAAY